MNAHTQITPPHRLSARSKRATPKGAVFVGPKSPWFLQIHDPGGSDCSAHTREVFRQIVWRANRLTYRAKARRELAGKDLACTCPPGQPCHADVLIEIANGKE